MDPIRERSVRFCSGFNVALCLLFPAHRLTFRKGVSELSLGNRRLLVVTCPFLIVPASEGRGLSLLSLSRTKMFFPSRFIAKLLSLFGLYVTGGVPPMHGRLGALPLGFCTKTACCDMSPFLSPPTARLPLGPPIFLDEASW